MKNILYIVMSALLLISCGSKEVSIDELLATGDSKAIADKKTELLNEKVALEKKIKEIQLYQNDNGSTKINTLVSVMEVKDTLFNHYIELQGSVDTKQNITIMPEMAGLLTRVYVTEGQRVTKGQRLATIDDGGMSQNLQQMKVQAQLAQTTYERQKRLWDQNIGSEIQYLQSKANYEAQQQAIGSMQQQLAKTTVRAPFTGTIDDVITDQGTVVNPAASPLFRLVSLKDMYVKVEVPETYLTAVKKGTEVEVFFPVLNETMKSKVRQSSNYINPANRAFSIEVPVDNKKGNIKPNLTARLNINDYTATNAVLIPLNVISENQNGDQYVMIVSDKDGDKIAQRRTITTGKTTGDLIEVLSGLQPGDTVITEGARTVREDQLIDIKEA